ncbi:MAG: hypothetical protein OQL08_13365 [Gammaproteobacteria bacterium]|nr:hypothetical protein [Gammaproteobacteria bacterium]
MHLPLQTLFQRPARLLIITASLLISAPSLCVGSYLADLEAEAGSTDVQAGEESELNWSHKKQGLSDGLQSGLTHEEFEQSLRDNYYGSFLFYEKLSPWNKKQVYKTYVESNDVEKIRREIKKRMTK